MLYDNGGLPAQNRPTGAMGSIPYTPTPRPPKPTYMPPAPKPNPNAYVPPNFNAPGAMVKPPKPGAYTGLPAPDQMRQMWLRRQQAMGGGMQPGQLFGGQQMGNYQQRPQQQAYNPVAAQFQYSMPQYQGNPFLPGIMK